MLKKRKPRETHPDHERILKKAKSDKTGFFIQMEKEKKQALKEVSAKTYQSLHYIINRLVDKYLASKNPHL